MREKMIHDEMNFKCEIKLDLINYYDILKSEIDIIAQESMIALERDSQSSDKNKWQEIVDLNKELIDIVESIFNSNCKQIDDYFLSNKRLNKMDKEAVKTIALSTFCTFISNYNLRNDYRNKNALGLLIVCDWYLDENQLNFVKYYLR
jgi:hypothetical protein